MECGYHLPFDQSVTQTLINAHKCRLPHFQIEWPQPADRPYNWKEELTHIKRQSIKGLPRIFIRASFFFNACGSVKPDDPDYEDKCTWAFKNITKDLHPCYWSGAKLILPFGSCVDKTLGFERMKEFIQGLPGYLQEYLLLENTGGEGNRIGSDLKEILDFLQSLEKAPQVVLNLSHLFISGQFDFRTQNIEYFEKFVEESLGWSRVAAVRISDTNSTFGSRKKVMSALGVGHLFGNHSILKGVIILLSRRTIRVIVDNIDDWVNDYKLIESLQSTDFDSEFTGY